MDWNELSTPALLIELGRLDANLAAMRRRMAERGVVLRPHLKTAKSVAVARRALGDAHRGITVSTLREAEHFASAGFQDITYAVTIDPGKLERAAALRRSGTELHLLVDGLEAARAVAAAAARLDVSFPVFVEIDCGGGRGGVLPDDGALLAIAAELDGCATRLAGVLTHAGQAYRSPGAESLARVAELERAAVVRAAERLRAAGRACPTVSAGSTPTAVFAGDLRGVTEMRPGVYMFFDLCQVGLGVCTRDEIALSVLATVIGHDARGRRLIVDAGALALSKDLSANEWLPGVGYGEVCEAGTLAPTGLCVDATNQEHGMIPLYDVTQLARFPIGSRVRILPNHACLTAAAHERYVVVDAEEIVDEWPRVNGW